MHINREKTYTQRSVHIQEHKEKKYEGLLNTLHIRTVLHTKVQKGKKEHERKKYKTNFSMLVQKHPTIGYFNNKAGMTRKYYLL